MSVGLFMGIRQSYTEEAQDSAEDYLAAINVALAARGLPPYVEPASAPNVYNDTERTFLFGRSNLGPTWVQLLPKTSEQEAKRRRADLSGTTT